MKRRIESDKEKFFLEATKTFPVEPTTFNITLNAFGIPCSLEKDNELVEQEYISACREKQVIPYSVLELESTNDGTFEFGLSPIEMLSHDRRGKTEEEIIQGLLRRDKIYRIIFKQKNGYGGLQKLQEDYLWNLERDGYKLSSAFLYLGEFDPRPYGSVQMVRWHPKLPQKVAIDIEEGNDTEELLKIISWAKNLESKL